MVLRQCRECGNPVSSKAAVCPSCGAPLKRAARKSSTLGGCSGCLVIVVVAFVCIAVFSGRPTGPPKPDANSVSPKPDAARKPANTVAKASPPKAPQKEANTGGPATAPQKDANSEGPAKLPSADYFEAVHNSLDAEASTLIDKYPTNREVADNAVEQAFEFVKKSKTEQQFKVRSLQLQRLSCFYFARSHPDKTESDVEGLKKELKKLDERLARTFADLIQNGDFTVETTRSAVVDDNRDKGDAATKNEDELEVDGLVLLRKSVTGRRGEVTGEITGTVVNRRDHKLNYAQITFNLYDASGAQVGSAIANINGLEPGGRWNFKAVTLGTDFVKYKFAELSGF
jgi:hypothetical protein